MSRVALDRLGVGAALHRDGPAALRDREGIVLVHGLGAVVVDRERLVVLHGGVHVVLAVDGDLLLALRVVHGHLVVAAATLGGVGLHAADDHLAGQFERDLLLGVVDPADDQGLVRVPFQVVDHHFLADAGQVDAAEGLARVNLGDANPAGAVLVHLPVPVPVKLDFHPAELVRVEFLARRPDHDGGLCALDERLGRAARGELDPGVDRRERAGKGLGVRLLRVCLDRVGGHEVLRGGHQVLAVLVLPRVVLEREREARADPAGVGLSGQHLVLGLEFLDPDRGVLPALAVLRERARVLEDLVVRARMGLLDGGRDAANSVVDTARLHAVGRLGGRQYCRVRDIFEMTRPKVTR